MTDDKTKNLIDNKELAGVLKNIRDQNGKPIDLVAFNACLMGQTEVAYQLRDVAKYMVGSEETEAGLTLPLPGLYGTTPQHKVMATLEKGVKEKGDITPEELSKLYVFESKSQFGSKVFTPTQAAYNLEKMEAVKDACDGLAASFLKMLGEKPESVNALRNAISESQHFLALDMHADPYNDFVDLGDFAKHVLKNKELAAHHCVKEAAEKVLAASKEAVIAEHHTPDSMHGKVLEGSTGLSVYLPDDYGFERPSRPSSIVFSPTHNYDKTSFAEDTKWDEFLTAIGQDKAFYRFLQKHGATEETVNKVHRAITTYNSIEEKVLPMAKMEGYSQAKNILSGHLKPNFWSIAGIGGGLIRGGKGLGKFVKGITEDYTAMGKAKVLTHGAIDTIVGVGSVVAGVAMFAGAGTVAIPAAAAVLGLGVARAITLTAMAAAKAITADRMTVSEKLDKMENAG